MNAPTSVVGAPSAFWTSMSTVPAAWAGVVAVSVVGETMVTWVAGRPPIRTRAPSAKSVPVTVTAVPPAVVPRGGSTRVMAGAAM